MLLVRKHWHDASERNPHREARLLCFSTGGAPNAGEGGGFDPDARLGDMTGREVIELLRTYSREQALENKTRKDIESLIKKLEKRIENGVHAGDIDATALLEGDEQAFVERLLQTDLVQPGEKPLLESEHMSDFNAEIRDVRDRIREVLDTKLQNLLEECKQIAKTGEHGTFGEMLAAYRSTKQPAEQAMIDAHPTRFFDVATDGRVEFLQERLRAFMKNHPEVTRAPEMVTDFADSVRPEEKSLVELRRESFEEIAAATLKDAAANTEAKPERLSPRDISARFNTVVGQLDELRHLHVNNRIGDTMKKSLGDEEHQAFLNTLNLFDAQYETASNLQGIANALNDWKELKLTPDAFRAKLEEGFADDPRLAHLLSAFDAETGKRSIVDDVKKWNDGNLEQTSVKIEITDRVWRAINGKRLLEELEDYLKAWAGHVEKCKAALAKAQGKEPETSERVESKPRDWLKNISRENIGGFGLYTPLEVYEAGKMLIQAFNEARQQKTQQMATLLGGKGAAAMAGLKLPYGDAVNRRFGSIAESNFNKVKNEYKEELGDDSFQVLYDKFQDSRNFPPYAIAILEVAASHGWLYEIAELSADEEQKEIYVFGAPYRSVVPSHWDDAQIDNYFGTLHRQNIEGGNTQRKNGHDRIITQADPDVYLKRIDNLLNAHDYWQAMGVGEALIERGKMPEASEFITAKFIEHLRTNPNARKYMNKTVLEQVSMMKWNQALTHSQNMIVMQMGQVKALYRDRDAMEGPLLSTIAMLESEIRSLDGSMEQDEITKNVAKIMSGQTVTIKGRPLSIYRDQYRQYWDEEQNSIFGFYKGEEFAKKLGADNFNDAGLLQLPNAAVESIFETGSPGYFEHPDLARNFAGYAIKRYGELKESDPEAARVFHAYMSEKLKNAIEKAFTAQAPKQLYRFKWKQANEEGQWLLASLVYWGFLSMGDLEAYSRGHQGAAEFMEHIRTQHAEVTANPIWKKESRAGPDLPPQLMR